MEGSDPDDPEPWWDPDLVCAIMANSGATQEEIDRDAPPDCSNHWLSKKELRRRMMLGGNW